MTDIIANAPPDQKVRLENSLKAIDQSACKTSAVSVPHNMTYLHKNKPMLPPVSMYDPLTHVLFWY